MGAVKKNVIAYLWITLASAIYAVGFNWCYEPNQIGFGGITGVGQIINHFIPGIPIGTAVILLNIPLFLLGWRLLGGHLLVSSLYAMLASSVFVDLLHLFYTFQPMEPFLACVFGGVIIGLSLGIIFLQGATTGGTELLARLLKFRFRHLSIGRLCLMIDLVVIFLYALVFRSVHNALYGIIALTISSKVMDMVIYGSASAKMAYIISSRPDAICRRLLDMGLGVTTLTGQGAYTGAEKRVILCAFKRNQIASIKAVVMEEDPQSFLIVCEAHEILGEGFGEYSPDSL